MKPLTTTETAKFANLKILRILDCFEAINFTTECLIDNEKYVRWWCDEESFGVRWLFIKTTSKNISDYTHGKISALKFICNGISLVLIDTGWGPNIKKVITAHEVEIHEITKYLPNPRAFYLDDEGIGYQ